MKSPAMPVRPAKDPNIETLRGLAILLVVAGHVIGIDATGGMKVADDSLWRYLYASLQYVRMPLFTAISGWVYALHPVAAHEAGTFIFKKARRLLLPMVCVGTLYFLMQYITPGTNRTGELAEIWKIYLLPYTVYWYLPALFLIFGAVAALDVHGACTTLRRWGIWLLIACAGVLIEPQLSSRLPNVFSIWGALCLLPFFLLGVGIRRFRAKLATTAMRRLYFAGFLAGLLIQQLVWFSAGNSHVLRAWFLHLPIGIVASAFLLTLKWENRLLIRLGSYAYGIYLFHAFGTSGGRILLTHAGIHSQTAIFLLSMCLGIGIPILVEIVLRRFPLLSTLFLGRKMPPRSARKA